MNNVISLVEVKIKLDIEAAEEDLSKVKTMIVEGKEVPDNIIPELVTLISELEKQLKKVIENGYL